MKKLLALSLTRPWPILIARGIKRVENRKWEPGRRLLPGEWFAIHSAKSWAAEAILMAQGLGVPLDLFETKNIQASVITCVARFDGTVTKSDDPWFFGPVGWVLGKVVEIAPVPCSGAQGLWDVPPDVADLVRAGYRWATRTGADGQPYEDDPTHPVRPRNDE